MVALSLATLSNSLGCRKLCRVTSEETQRILSFNSLRSSCVSAIAFCLKHLQISACASAFFYVAVLYPVCLSDYPPLQSIWNNLPLPVRALAGQIHLRTWQTPAFLYAAVLPPFKENLHNELQACQRW